MSKLIGGTLFIRNALALDYCLRESLESLLGVCQHVVVVDAGSTDGTSKMLEDWAAQQPKLTVLTGKWEPKSNGEGKWLSGLGNQARLHLKTPYHFHLQADEVLHPDDYPIIERFAEKGIPMMCQRYNFWLNARQTAPKGRLCGVRVIRGGPQHIPLVGDSENLSPDCPWQESAARIYHVGFLRKTEAWIAKSIGMEEAMFNTHNPAFDRAKTEGRKAIEDCVTAEELLPFTGDLPPSLIPWLKERNAL